jgi:effector-binding domain-containing protein
VYAALGPHASEAGQTWAIWYDQEYKEHDVDGAAAFLLRSRVPESGRMHVHALPAATMASAVHQGSSQTLIQAQEALLKWIEANGYRIVGPSREMYLHNTMPIRHDPSSVTEIQFPVEKALGPTDRSVGPRARVLPVDGVSSEESENHL